MRNDIFDEITSESSCWLAIENKKVIGFTWGYPIKLNILEKKLGLVISQRCKEEFGEKLEIVAYQDEIGVIKRYRRKGIGKQLFIRRLNDFRLQGLRVGIARTKTNPPTVTYLWYRRMGYKIIAEYNDEDGRVILGVVFDTLVI